MAAKEAAKAVESVESKSEVVTLSLYADVAAAALAAQASGDHATHGLLHSLETVLGEAKVRVAAIVDQLEGDHKAVAQRIKDAL